MQDFFREQAIGKPKRDRTRAMLLDGIVAVCARRGLDSATVQEVTRHSGLAQGTFYNHFVDREALIVEAAKAILVGVHLKIGQRVRGMPAGIHRMVVAIDSTISEAVVLPDHGKLLSETIGRYPAITDEVRPALRADMRAGRRSGQMHVRASRLLDEQIGALIGLAIRLRLSGNTKGAINRSTCEAAMRLLGQSPKQAVATVAEAYRLADD